MNDNPTTGTTDKLSEFIGREREKYADTNLFAFGLGQAHRYYRFLHIIISRYADVSAKFMENTERQLAISKAQGSGPIGAEHWRLTLEARDLQDQLHLEIESFCFQGDESRPVRAPSPAGSAMTAAALARAARPRAAARSRRAASA